jgi:hypothetical protein
MKSSRCHPPASERKLNAAPRLYTYTMLKNGVTSMLSCSVNVRMTASLVMRSSTITMPERRSHLGMGSRLP